MVIYQVQSGCWMSTGGWLLLLNTRDAGCCDAGVPSQQGSTSS